MKQSYARNFTLLSLGWTEAGGRHQTEVLETMHPFGPVRFETRGFDPTFLQRAYSHRLAEQSYDHSLTVRLFYHDKPGLPEGAPVSFDPLLSLLGRPQDRYVGICRPGLAAWFDTQQGVVVGCCNPKLCLPTDLGKPLHSFWTVQLLQMSIPALHADLVASENSGILLLGGCDTGKSTVTLACLQAGLRMVANDCVVFDPDTNQGSGLYSGVWLRRAHAQALGIASVSVDELHHPGDPKSCYFLPANLMSQSCRISVGVVPDSKRKPGLESVSREEAMAITGPTSFANYPSLTESGLRKLLGSVAIYRMGTSEYQAIPGLLAKALEERNS